MTGDEAMTPLEGTDDSAPASADAEDVDSGFVLDSLGRRRPRGGKYGPYLVSNPYHFPGTRAMRELPGEPACAAPMHAAHSSWWLNVDTNTMEGLEKARAAALVCSTECPAAVFKACEELARDVLPTTGIWAGRAWTLGKNSGHRGRPLGKDLLR